jgi:hypothetical protein
MPLDLHPPISSYFEARNAHDAAATAALFTEDGRVHDEPKTIAAGKRSKAGPRRRAASTR